MRIPTFVLTLGLVVLAAGMGYAFYHQHATQAKLNQQVQELDYVLGNDNDDASIAAVGYLRGLQAEVLKNQNQPSDTALLARAEAFTARADSLVRTLRRHREALLRASGIPPASIGLGLPYPDATQAVATQLADGTSAHRNLTAQLTGYVQARRELNPNDTNSVGILAVKNWPLVAALARLTQLESDVRTTEIRTLEQLRPKLGAAKLLGRMVAVATAEAGTVAPGTTYRAKLYLAKVLQGSRVVMTCNGRPVPVGSDGEGIVRFVAPRRPGPAVWFGTVHLKQNGRDTTFQVRVPYRVVRH